MLGVSLRDEIQNEKIRRLTKGTDVTRWNVDATSLVEPITTGVTGYGWLQCSKIVRRGNLKENFMSCSEHLIDETELNCCIYYNATRSGFIYTHSSILN
ncbi:hypothetical protein EVAR_2214_1 [Eumeta japonica]|uniref:Uncharacterized protein n=1 Tax=Eumeta variegata TaxID=151549 RepID=A0A4C1SIC2_EUMVA|nr:hypothetical protein EVAR_2214_1 [Eumeta japonica]